MYENYIKTITSTLEEHAPSSRRKHTKRKHKSWFNEEALKLKVQRRKAEKIWQRRKCELHKGFICKLTSATRNAYFKQNRIS